MPTRRSVYSLIFAIARTTGITDTHPLGRYFKITDRTQNWQKIWNNRGISSLNQPQDISLQDLLIADGFDTPTARLNSLEVWEEYIRFIEKK